MNIITNNCLGGHIYKDLLKTEYKNPFIWTLFEPDDYIDFIDNFDNINFENYEIDKVGEGLSNNFQIVIEGKYHIKCIHHHFDVNADKPFIKGTDVYYNRIWEYINEKYLKRLERMKKEKNTIFIYYEPNLECNKITLLTEIAKKHKCLAFTNKLESTKELKVYPIDKSWKAPPPLIQHYNKEILEFINENRDNNDKLD